VARHRLWWAALALALTGAAVWSALRAPLGGDYPGPPCDSCDYAGPAIDALTDGDPGRFFSVQPVMGSASLLLRAPFAALAHSELARYRLGALACLLVLVGAALLVARAMERRGAARLPTAVVCGLMVAGPLTGQALNWGHPEELMAGALCVVAVLLAAQGRGVAGGAALGTAIATKPWALLAVVPVVMVAADRRRLLAAGAGVAALLTLPMMLGDPHRFFGMAHAFGSPEGSGVTPSNIWWPYHHQAGVELTPHGEVTTWGIPRWISAAAHPLVTLVAVGAAVLYWRRRPGRGAQDALGLLALIFLARCLLDPLTYGYHHAPFLVALLAFGGLRARGIPWAGILVSGAAWAMVKWVAPHGDLNLLNRVYVLWALPAAGWLVLALYFPRALSGRTWTAGRERSVDARAQPAGG
jgi:hypothetical protein